MAKRSTSPAQTWVAATDSPPEPALPEPLPQLPKAGARPAEPVQLLLRAHRPDLTASGCTVHFVSQV